MAATAAVQVSKNRGYIPIVNHVITERDLDAKATHYKLPTEIDLKKLLKLLTDKHSKGLVERHCRSIKILCSCHKNGIHLKDVLLVLEILKICHEYISVDSRYEELVCFILNLFRQPFLKSKVSDEISYVSVVSQCLSELGRIAEISSDKIKCSTSSSITTLYTHEITKEHQSVSTDFIKEATQKSTICKSLAECLLQVSDESSKIVLLKSLASLSDSQSTCDRMLEAGIASTICIALNVYMKDYQLLFLGVEALWNLLENGSSPQIISQISSELCLKSLKSTFLKYIGGCRSQAERQLRNDVFVLITLICSKCTDGPLVESGMVKLIASYTSYPEIPTRDEYIRHYQVTKHEEDFELKKLFFSCINILCTHTISRSMLEILSSCQVMLALFSYAIPIKQPLETHWSVAEFEELQLEALSVLAGYAPLSIDDYIQFQGNTRLLALLDWCINSEDFGGHGNSFHGNGGRGSKRAQMRYCIRLLRAICSCGNEYVMQDLTDQGIIAQLVAILDSCSSSTDNNDSIDIELQCDMLFILALLCEGDIHRKELFGGNGVTMLTQYLNGYLNMKNGPLNNNRLVLSTSDCIWSAVIGCYLSEVCFFEKEGIFMLLDLLEICSEKMQNVVMGLLVDLMENKNALKHMNLWRSKDNKTISKLLIQLWIAEERKLDVKRDSNGVILDTTFPLKTWLQEEQLNTIKQFSFASVAIVDVLDNLRAKIFSLFYRLGFKNLPGLLQVDYVAMAIIENYLNFKTLEVWQEIDKELKEENIEPVSSDQQCMNIIINSIQNHAEEISNLQKLLIKSDIDEKIFDEQEFYKKIKESHKQAEEKYLDFVYFVKRTSNYSVLKAARQLQLQSIERSRLISKNGIRNKRNIEHTTMDKILQTTVFCGRNILVESTPLFNESSLQVDEGNILPSDSPSSTIVMET